MSAWPASIAPGPAASTCSRPATYPWARSPAAGQPGVRARYRHAVRSSECDVLVVGAGVCGLTTAICLAEAGARAVIRTAAPPDETTSSVAGAIWGPHLVEESDRVDAWGRDTLAVLRELAADPAAAVRTLTGVQATRGVPGPAGPPEGTPAAPPHWMSDL